MISAPPVPQHCIFISPWYVGLFFSFVKLGICRRDSCTLYLRQNFIMTWVSSVKMPGMTELQCEISATSLQSRDCWILQKSSPQIRINLFFQELLKKMCVPSTSLTPSSEKGDREVKKDSLPPFLVRMEGVQGKIVLSKFPTYRDVQNIEKSHLQHFLLP